MADETFLELCQEFAREVGVQGSGPSTTVGQTGEHDKVVRYIINADLDIKRRHMDWKFLWRDDFTVTLALNDQTINTATSGWPANLGRWNPDAFYIDKTADDFVHLEWVPYKHWLDVLNVGSQTASTPTQIAIAPDKTLRLHPKADGAYTLTGEYWKAPVALSGNTTESDIPGEFRRLIVVRAKLYYAEHEDAPEIAQMAGAEHDDLMGALEAQYGPEQAPRGFLSAPESYRQVVVPQ